MNLAPYLTKGLCWGLMAFAITGVWFAPVLMGISFSGVFWLSELTENRLTRTGGKGAKYPFATFGALTSLLGAAAVSLAIGLGRMWQ